MFIVNNNTFHKLLLITLHFSIRLLLGENLAEIFISLCR